MFSVFFKTYKELHFENHLPAFQRCAAARENGEQQSFRKIDCQSRHRHRYGRCC